MLVRLRDAQGAGQMLDSVPGGHASGRGLWIRPHNAPCRAVVTPSALRLNSAGHDQPPKRSKSKGGANVRRERMRAGLPQEALAALIDVGPRLRSADAVRCFHAAASRQD